MSPPDLGIRGLRDHPQGHERASVIYRTVTANDTA